MRQDGPVTAVDGDARSALLAALRALEAGPVPGARAPLSGELAEVLAAEAAFELSLLAGVVAALVDGEPVEARDLEPGAAMHRLAATLAFFGTGEDAELDGVLEFARDVDRLRRRARAAVGAR